MQICFALKYILETWISAADACSHAVVFDTLKHISILRQDVCSPHFHRVLRLYCSSGNDCIICITVLCSVTDCRLLFCGGMICNWWNAQKISMHIVKFQLARCFWLASRRHTDQSCEYFFVLEKYLFIFQLLYYIWRKRERL